MVFVYFFLNFLIIYFLLVIYLFRSLSLYLSLSGVLLAVVEAFYNTL